VTERLPPYRPRRAAIARCLESAIPMPDDAEAKDERRICRRMDHKEALE
jgi:hypothetical protein